MHHRSSGSASHHRLKPLAAALAVIRLPAQAHAAPVASGLCQPIILLPGQRHPPSPVERLRTQTAQVGSPLQQWPPAAGEEPGDHCSTGPLLLAEDSRDACCSGHKLSAAQSTSRTATAPTQGYRPRTPLSRSPAQSGLKRSGAPAFLSPKTAAKLLMERQSRLVAQVVCQL